MGDSIDADAEGRAPGSRSRRAKSRTAASAASAHRRVADDAAPPVGLGLAGLELRLHEGDEEPPGREGGPDGEKHRAKRDEGEVHQDGVVGPGGGGSRGP